MYMYMYNLTFSCSMSLLSYFSQVVRIDGSFLFSHLGGYSQQQGTSSSSAAVASAAAASSVALTSGSVMTMECPQATMMGNHAEGDLWMVDIQLMYAQHWPEQHHHQQQHFSSQHEQSIQAQQQLLRQQILLARGGVGGGGMGMGTGIGTGAGMMVGGGGHGGGVGVASSSTESLKRPEKPLRELLEEQDIGMSLSLSLSFSSLE